MSGIYSFFTISRLWEHSLTLQCEMILLHQPSFDLQLSNYSLKRNSIQERENNNQEENQVTELDSNNNNHNHNLVSEKNENQFFPTNLENEIPQELQEDDNEEDEQEGEDSIDDDDADADVDIENFSDHDSILEPLEDHRYQLSNQFSTHIMLLSRIIFKLTNDQIYSFYENYLLQKLTIPFLNNIKIIKFIHDTNPEQLDTVNTSELGSEV